MVYYYEPSETWRDSRHVQKPTTFGLLVLSITMLSLFGQTASAIHHLQRPPVHLVHRENSDLPLIVTSNCAETIYPAILTQSGRGPDRSGFRLDPGVSMSQNVSADWRGRVWGRTNCTFNPDGSVPASSQGGAACSSGDCGAFVECQGAVSWKSILILVAPQTDLSRAIRLPP